MLKIAGPHMGFNPESHLGGERYEASWLRVMNDPRLQFHWVVPTDLGHTEGLPPNHQFHRVARARGLSRVLTEARALRRLRREQGIGLFRFHSVEYGAPVAAALRAVGDRTPILFQHLHVEEPKAKYMRRARLMATLGAHFVSISEASHEELVSLGVARARSAAIQTIILDWNPDLTGCAQRDAGPRAYDLAYVGGLVARKRPELVLKTAFELNKLLGNRRARVALVGRGERLESLRRLARETDVDADFFPSCDDTAKWELLRRSRIFLFPSSQEGFGYAPLEAALAGLWVISSAAGSLPEVLTGIPGASCVPEERFVPEHLARLCQERLDAWPAAVPEERVRHWTDHERWRRAHENLLFQLSAK